MVPKTKKDFFLRCKGTSYVKTLRGKSLLAHFAAKKEPFPWGGFLFQWLYLYLRQLLQVASWSRCYHLNSDARIRVSTSQQVAQRRRASKQDRKKSIPLPLFTSFTKIAAAVSLHCPILSRGAAARDACYPLLGPVRHTCSASAEQICFHIFEKFCCCLCCPRPAKFAYSLAASLLSRRNMFVFQQISLDAF